ncbi:tetratricopeptide repeat protein [Merdimonas faecis]|uniref:tetratricopeptide repeat protein n=1 Tax=Merdimonas faecis TaxID=1653435 RepID=UPI0008636F56|nr:tetratricopeptide repeat protein [Merdimonas faecis]
MILYPSEYQKMVSFIQKSKNTFAACIVRGDYGKGKSRLINQVLKTCPISTLSVCQYPGMNTPYEALFSALCQKCAKEQIDFEKNNIEISHREYLKQLCVRICKQIPNTVIIFQDMKDFDQLLIELILEILQFLKINDISCLVIMEFSTDNLSFKQREEFTKCIDICGENNILLNSKDYRDYVKYFSSLLPGKNGISSQQIQSIIKEAFYNPGLLKKMAYYFMDVGIFYQDGDLWNCDELDFHLTAKLFEKHIYQRYSKLDEVLKRTLDKACITGFEINSTLMYQPLGILKAEENLRRIERLSRLIVHTENSYEFENNTVYNLINDKMNLSEKKAQHLLIAEFLYKKLYDLKRNNTLLHILNIIKIHYLGAEKIDEALHILGVYIQQSYEMRNFDAALIGIREFFKLSNGKFPYAEQQLLLKEMEIYTYLGQFTNAYNSLKCIKKRYVSTGIENWIEYWNAYCLFNCGQTKEAKIVADALIEKIDENQINDEYLTLKTDILLAGMYHHFGDIAYASKRYEQGLAISLNKNVFHKEYNYLLSISNMFLDNELAIDKIEQSMKYFEKEHLLVSYAKSANNVAINYLYLKEYETAIKYLNRSNKIFTDMCSVSYHYPLNNLGTVYAYLNDFDKALDCFFKALNSHTDPFSQLWISMNIANCKRKIGQSEEAEDILNRVKNGIRKLDCNTYLLMRNFHISKALLYEDQNNYTEAYSHSKKALEIEVNSLHNKTYDVYLGKLVTLFSTKSYTSIPEIANTYNESTLAPFFQDLLENQIHLGNLLFWEI